MGLALVFLLVLAFFPFYIAIMASGLLLLFKPEGLRPPWWDWGINDPIAESDAASEVELAPVELARPMKVETKTVAKTARPRW